MAQHHESKAAGLERQLANSIFSDDGAAIAQLQARLVQREAERSRIKAFNASCRKGSPDESLLDDKQRVDLATLRRICSYQLGKHGEFPTYALAGLSGRIKADRDRIEAITKQQQRQNAAEDAGGIMTPLDEEYHFQKY